MTRMRRFSIAVLLLALLAAAGLWGLYRLRSLETQTLGPEARSTAPGDFVALSDGLTHYQLAGPEDGPPVVLVHGFSVPFYIWDGTCEALADSGFRVLRYDLFGRGFSDRPPGSYDGERFVRQLAEIITAAELEPPVDVAGLSMGGAVVVAFAAQHPELTRRLVLIDPLAQGAPSPELPETVARYLTAVKDAHHMAEGQLQDFYRPERFPQWPQRYREQMRYAGFQRAVVSTRYHFLPEDHLARYRQVGRQGKEALLIWGREDQTLPFAASRTVLEALPATFLPVDEAGHLPHLEHPREVNGRIVDFLRGPG